jgi:hypothetical protein
MNYYEVIHAHAPGGTTTASGDLHEDIWDTLLRLEDPNFHNVRVTRGDGGIDGIVFIDPVGGKCRIYQAKCVPELKDDTGDRKDSIVKAFVTAMLHRVECVQWTLLLPRELSHADLNWLMIDLRADAVVCLEALVPPKPIAVARAKRCAIAYKDGADLDRLLRANLDVAARLLPESSLALIEAVHQERAARTRDRAELADRLNLVKDEAMRRHATEARVARAALSILNQRWGSSVTMLQLWLMNPNRVPTTLIEIARQVELLALSRTPHAFACEGLVPGISRAISTIHYESLVLQQVATNKDLGLIEADAEDVIAQRMIAAINDLQDRISEVNRTTAPSDDLE